MRPLALSIAPPLLKQRYDEGLRHFLCVLLGLSGVLLGLLLLRFSRTDPGTPRQRPPSWQADFLHESFGAARRLGARASGAALISQKARSASSRRGRRSDAHRKFVNFEPRGNLGLFLRVPKVSTSKAHAKRGDSVRNHPVL